MTAEFAAGLVRGWHPVAYVDAVREAPVSAMLMGMPLVVFRSGQGIAVLEDRCPHRGVPLSGGRCIGGTIECPYHGWRFDGAGACAGIAGSAAIPAAAARALPVRVEAGLVWTCLAAVPAGFPQLPPELTDPSQDRFWWKLPADAFSIADGIENLLDPIHSFFLHPGLVRRSREPAAMDVEFVADVAGCQARYTERTRHMTLLQRLTEGERTQSWGRYFAPTIVQIAFDDRHGPAATITVVFAPEDRLLTRPYAHFATRRGLAPAWLKRWFIIAFHRPVIAQDRAMLKLQACHVERFGGPDYHSGPLDIFGPIIWAALNGRPIKAESRSLTIGG